ncbi:MAG: hypothetical protein NVSMB63_16860 [Sediminibacterium sp.]
MGSGIAQVAAQAGFHTIQFDPDALMLEKSRAAIAKNLLWLEEKGKIGTTEREHIRQRILFTTQAADCIGDVVIEAIAENREAKQLLFQQLAAINQPHCILATNTSSIPIHDIAAAVPNPSRVVGMHFFNPAPVMKLVEIIRGVHTADAVVQQIVSLAGQMGKTAVVCKDAPGFIVNRVARHYYLEAMKLVADGLADYTTVDRIMEASGFKMGPFKLMDLIGIDINYNVSHIVWEALGRPERLTPSAMQKAKLDAGELGRKTGKGFYQYDCES